MQKKIIVLALALAFAAPAAFAETDKAELEKLRAMVQELDQKIRTLEHKLESKNEAAAPVRASASTSSNTTASANTAPGITVYGQADLSYDRINNGTSAAGVAGASKGNVSSNVSRIGFKGSEGLSDSLSAIWQIEQQINIDNSTANANTFASRNSFLGLKSDSAGTVLLGRHDTPYKLATRRLDVFADSIADNRALLGGVTSPTTVKSASSAFDGRQPDIILYTSPAMSGFTGTIAYANLAEPNTTAAAAKASLLSLAGMYDVAPFYGSLGYEEHKLDTARAGGKESAWKLGLGYTMDAFTLGFAYEKTSDSLGAGAAGVVGAACAAKAAGSDCLGHNAYYLSGNYKMGMNAVKLAYGKAGQLASTANTGANQVSLGYDHGLSKRTKLYAIYSRISNKTGSDYGFSQSTASTGTVNGIGSSPSVVSLGMRHSF
ncbi:MAG TPA: porin [Gallionella sp.]|nr:porin [Gallionella sp.]